MASWGQLLNSTRRPVRSPMSVLTPESPMRGQFPQEASFRGTGGPQRGSILRDVLDARPPVHIRMYSLVSRPVGWPPSVGAAWVGWKFVPAASNDGPVARI